MNRHHLDGSTCDRVYVDVPIALSAADGWAAMGVILMVISMRMDRNALWTIRLRRCMAPRPRPVSGAQRRSACLTQSNTACSPAEYAPGNAPPCVQVGMVSNVNVKSA